MAETTAFSELNPRQRRCVVLYTSEARKGTYLNRIASYSACYSTNQPKKSIANNAYRLFKRPDIQAAIKELLPNNAYDVLFLREEGLEMYNKAKTDDDKNQQYKLWVEMCKHEGMYDKKKDAEVDTGAKKELDELQTAINNNFRKRAAEMKGAQNGSQAN